MEKFKIINIKNINGLPKTAGVYAFLASPKPFGEGGFEIIYIGKAINIKDRVKNHFQQPTYRDNLFISAVEKIGYINAGSEIEALILEASLIKTKQPKYNVVWKDDKNYFYVAIAYNKDKIPYIYITHQPTSPSRRVIPNLIGNLELNTRSLDSRFRENDNIKYIGPFTEGNPLKNTLRVLRKIFPFYTSKIHPKKKCTYCHLNLCPGPNPDIKQYKKDIKNLILILQGKKNTALNLLKKEMTTTSKQQNFEKAGKIRDQIYNLQQVMSHAKVNNWNNPGIDQNWLASNDLHSNTDWESTQKKLQNILNIKNNINKIECYDISNTQGTFAVGSMVVFVNGTADKSQYKKFKIKMKNEPNDIAMLKEVLQRRMTHPEWTYPQVILMDGGKGQLNAAIEIKNKLLTTNYKLQTLRVISIAKGRQELFIEGQKNAIPLKELPQEIYNLIKNLDDEAHRFAITYHKKLRKKYLLK